MRLTKSFAFAVSALALSTGAAFAGETALTDRTDPMGYQPDYVYDVYIVPAEAIVLVPLEPSEVPISADELG